MWIEWNKVNVGSNHDPKTCIAKLKMRCVTSNLVVKIIPKNMNSCN